MGEEEMIGKVISLAEAKAQKDPARPYQRHPLLEHPTRLVSEKESDELVKGFIDMHCHGAPEGSIPERPTVLETSIEATRVGWKAILFKDHYTLTSDRAWIIQEYLDKWAPEEGLNPVRIYGALTLNYSVGGLNPEAVIAAMSVDFGKFTKCIWMPSLSSAWQWKFMGKEGGITILENGKLKPEVKEIIKLVANAPTKVCIATSHLSVPESMVLAEEGAAAGVDVIVTHATQELTIVTMDEAKELIKRGAWIELCQCSMIGTPYIGVGAISNFNHSIRLIKELGPSRIIVSTDAGQPGSFPVPEARRILRVLVTFGISKEDVDIMSKKNPAKLLGIE
jgi:hypothetical protein